MSAALARATNTEVMTGTGKKRACATVFPGLLIDSVVSDGARHGDNVVGGDLRKRGGGAGNPEPDG